MVKLTLSPFTKPRAGKAPDTLKAIPLGQKYYMNIYCSIFVLNPILICSTGLLSTNPPCINGPVTPNLPLFSQWCM